MTHDPRDVETVARLICAMGGDDPDQEAMRPGDGHWVDQWKLYKEHATRGLDTLQAKGWKITTPHEFPAVSRESGKVYKPLSWSIMHDAAPICPREDR